MLYELLPGETPEMVASRQGMTSAELLDFHNRRCSDLGLLWISGFAGVQKIIIPANFRSPEDLRRLKEEFLPAKNFSPNLLASKYRISEKFSNPDEGQTEITYDLDLDFSIKEISGNRIPIVSQNRINFKKNGEHPDDKVSSLALECMNAISPIEFVVSEEGKLFNLLDNKKLVSKFKEKKAAIQDFHIGEVAEHYIKKFEESLADEDYLFGQLTSPLYNQILFLGNSIYHQSGTFEKKLNIIPNSFPVNISFTNQYDFDDEDFSVVYLYGDIIEKCSLEELLRGKRFDDEPEEFLNGTLNITYTISKNSRQLQEVFAEVLLRHDEEIYHQYNLNITNNEQ